MTRADETCSVCGAYAAFFGFDAEGRCGHCTPLGYEDPDNGYYLSPAPVAAGYDPIAGAHESAARVIKLVLDTVTQPTSKMFELAAAKPTSPGVDKCDEVLQPDVDPFASAGAKDDVEAHEVATSSEWACPSCGCVWPSFEYADGYGCQSIGCTH